MVRKSQRLKKTPKHLQNFELNSTSTPAKDSSLYSDSFADAGDIAEHSAVANMNAVESLSDHSQPGTPVSTGSPEPNQLSAPQTSMVYSLQPQPSTLNTNARDFQTVTYALPATGVPTPQPTVYSSAMTTNIAAPAYSAMNTVSSQSGIYSSATMPSQLSAACVPPPHIVHSQPCVYSSVSMPGQVYTVPPYSSTSTYPFNVVYSQTDTAYNAMSSGVPNPQPLPNQPGMYSNLLYSQFKPTHVQSSVQSPPGGHQYGMYPNYQQLMPMYHQGTRKLHDLPIFTGRPEEWPIFFTSFQWLMGTLLCQIHLGYKNA